MNFRSEEWQHDRTQTWINVFNLIGSHGGCDILKHDKFGVVDSLGEVS